MNQYTPEQQQHLMMQRQAQMTMMQNQQQQFFTPNQGNTPQITPPPSCNSQGTMQQMGQGNYSSDPFGDIDGGGRPPPPSSKPPPPPGS